MAREKAGALTRPTDEQCIAATGCSRAELAAAARRLPVRTLVAALGLPRDTPIDETFVDRAVEALTGEVANVGE